jgi:hypothetical protein
MPTMSKDRSIDERGDLASSGVLWRTGKRGRAIQVIESTRHAKIRHFYEPEGREFESLQARQLSDIQVPETLRCGIELFNRQPGLAPTVD